MLATHKGEIPYLIYLLPFMAGVALALNVPMLPWLKAAHIIFLFTTVVFIGFNLFYRSFKVYRFTWTGGLLLHIVLFTAGIITTVKFDDRQVSTYFEKLPAGKMLLRINSEPQFKNGFIRFTASVKAVGKRATSGNLLVSQPVDSAHAAQYNYGDEVVIPGQYRAIDPPFNPAEFNYKQYLSRQNIYAQAFLQPGEIVVIAHNTGNQLVAYSLHLRQRMISLFKQHMHSKEAIAVASTLILGYKAELDDQVLQAYAQTGTIHVLSVSGTHVAIVFWLISWVLGFLGRGRFWRLTAATVSFLLIWYYALLSGLSPAVCRAAVMISFLIIGQNFNRQINTLNLLAASAFLLLLIDPFLLADVGFELSYLSVAGLIVFQPVIYNRFDVQNRWLDKLWIACSASLAAQAATFALSVYYFHQFPVYFLASNLFIAIPSVLIMYGGMHYLLVSAIGVPLFIKPIAFLFEQSILLMDHGLAFIAHLPYAYTSKLWITNAEQWLLFLLTVLVCCLFYYKKSVFLHLALICLLFFSASVSWRKIEMQQSSALTFLNLKKHTGVVFRQGNRGVVLTDLADTDKAFKYSVQPYLDSSGIRQVNVIGLDRDIAIAFLCKKKNLLRFLDKNILMVTPTLVGIDKGRTANVDYLFVAGSPHPDWQYLRRQFSYQQVIAASNNSERLLDTLAKGAAGTEIKINALKRNKSIIIVSKR
ncbi:competence protein ComEC [Mucilaginibacter yixingensis]|uniref:Competence protein ComEC n=1 Tax=Mucilaginibacter yixingensis TaxID=1295612 RepID=A0A2T5JEV6_9SPHI|nr:ComEC/Rec2 family competence protein [Mucilaginibacter yixingensis]PTR00972.1 competence protein ComEC [Mucilaginibacter yixingensis]